MSQPHYAPPPPPGYSPQQQPKPWSRTRFAIWTTLAAAVSFGLFGAIGACRSDDSPNPSACKARLAENYRKVMANGGKGPEAEEPAACVGLDDKTLERIMGEVISEYLDSDQAKQDLGKALKDG